MMAMLRIAGLLDFIWIELERASFRYGVTGLAGKPLFPLGDFAAKRVADVDVLLVIRQVGSFVRIGTEVVGFVGTFAAVADDYFVALHAGIIGVLVMADDRLPPFLLFRQRLSGGQPQVALAAQ